MALEVWLKYPEQIIVIESSAVLVIRALSTDDDPQWEVASYKCQVIQCSSQFRSIRFKLGLRFLKKGLSWVPLCFN